MLISIKHLQSLISVPSKSFNTFCRELSNGTWIKPLRQVLVSKVMGATLGKPGESLQLTGKVELFFYVQQPLYDLNRSSASCVFWKSQSLEWSTDGCEVIPSLGNF